MTSVGVVLTGPYEISQQVSWEGSVGVSELIAAKPQPAGLSGETILLLGHEPSVYATTKKDRRTFRRRRIGHLVISESKEVCFDSRIKRFSIGII